MRSRIFGLVLGLGTITGIAPAQNPQKLPPSTVVDTQATVTVRNDRKVPVWLYMEHGRFDYRLGVVPASSSLTLPIPASAARGLASVRLFVHPEGEVEDLVSQDFALQRNARLTMRVPSYQEMASAGPDTMSAVLSPEELDDATLTVDNTRNVQVTVFITHGVIESRIGTVPAGSKVTLRFPKSVVNTDRTITIFVHPEGGKDLASERIRVARGQHLGWRVSPQ